MINFQFQRQIKSLQQLAQLKGEDRRQLLRNLTESEYNDVMKVLGSLPFVDFKVRSEGLIFALIFIEKLKVFFQY